MRSALTSYHPAAAVLPFAAGIVFAMASFHPVYAGISLLCAAALALKIRGFKDLKRIAGFCVLLTTATVLINGAFNSNGFTPLMSVGPFSIMWEPVFFGLCSAAALCAMVLWFASYSAVIDGEKFMFLAARLSPSAALLLSMTLSQAAIMRRKYRDIDDAQIGIFGNDRKKFRVRLRLAALKLSVLLSWSMEDSVQTADSMHARGFGTGRMTKMNPYVFNRRDRSLLLLTASLSAVFVIFAALGYIRFRFYPVIQDVSFDTVAVFGYAAYFLLLSLPLCVEIKEACKWRLYMSKI